MMSKDGCTCRPLLYGENGKVISTATCDACCEREFYRLLALDRPEIFGPDVGEEWPATDHTEGTD